MAVRRGGMRLIWGAGREPKPEGRKSSWEGQERSSVVSRASTASSLIRPPHPHAPASPPFQSAHAPQKRQKGNVRRPLFFLFSLPQNQHDAARSACRHRQGGLAPLGRRQGHQVRRGARPDGGKDRARAIDSEAAEPTLGEENFPSSLPRRRSKGLTLLETRPALRGRALARARGATRRDGRQCRLGDAPGIGRAVLRRRRGREGEGE